jgi:hypothetical protein
MKMVRIAAPIAAAARSLSERAAGGKPRGELAAEIEEVGEIGRALAAAAVVWVMKLSFRPVLSSAKGDRFEARSG